MDRNYSKTHTSLNISESVLETIAKAVAHEVDGVYSLANLPPKNLLFTTPTSLKSINIVISSDVAIINVGIVLKINYKIKDVCEQVQQMVKDSVQNMTGITVAKVNVYVSGVKVAQE
ncbi:MAG: Asp23/Gls24 family envelope stress response protein [Oscillospiraceae bacterium]